MPFNSSQLRHENPGFQRNRGEPELSTDHFKKTTSSNIQAVAATSGEPRWRSKALTGDIRQLIHAGENIVPETELATKLNSFDVATGELRWSFESNRQFEFSKTHAVGVIEREGTPYLVSIRLMDGKVVWSKKGLNEKIKIHGDRVCFSSPGSDRYKKCLRQADGTIGAPINIDPVPLRLSNLKERTNAGVRYRTCSLNALCAEREATGELLWKMPAVGGYSTLPEYFHEDMFFLIGPAGIRGYRIADMEREFGTDNQ